YLPGHGLLVWHINYMPEYWKRNLVNTVRGMLGVDIVRADGNTASGHTFPGSSAITFLGDEGYPNMLSYGRAPTCAPISRIIEAGGVISFDICKAVTSLEKVNGIEALDITPTSFTLKWAPQTGADYRINIYTRENGNTMPVGAYENIIVPDAMINVEGLQPDTRYHATVTAVSGSVAGETSDEFSVDTPAWSFGFYMPQANEASDVSHDRFTASWQPLENATDYIVNVFTAGEPQLTASGTDFSDGLDALPSGWSTNCSSTMAINGYYGNASPSLLMSDDYARIQSPPVQGDITELSFWYRERSGSGLSHIEVSFLSDGKWSEPVITELPSRMSQGAVLTLSADKIPSRARAARIVYRRKEKGSLALDDIEIKYVSGQSYTPVENWTARHTGAGTTSMIVHGLLSATDYYYNVRGVDNSGTVSLESGMIKTTTLENSGITDTSHSTGPHVYVSPDGTVHTSGHDGPVEVFDFQGRSVNPEKLPHGIYLVKAGNKIFKLAI
ncbi:MAG: fibronectin type III domain-containing protein, partial [Muribaculaceae bacterium]|nr:fibronectin type III domain-containing protein [Muribaculaceae bacterium]